MPSIFMTSRFVVGVRSLPLPEITHKYYSHYFDVETPKNKKKKQTKHAPEPLLLVNRFLSFLYESMEVAEPFGSDDDDDDDEFSDDDVFDTDEDDEFSEPDELDFDINLVLVDDDELNVVLFELRIELALEQKGENLYICSKPIYSRMENVFALPG